MFSQEQVSDGPARRGGHSSPFLPWPEVPPRLLPGRDRRGHSPPRKSPVPTEGRKQSDRDERPLPEVTDTSVLRRTLAAEPRMEGTNREAEFPGSRPHGGEGGALRARSRWVVNRALTRQHGFCAALPNSPQSLPTAPPLRRVGSVCVYRLFWAQDRRCFLRGILRPRGLLCQKLPVLF